MKIERIYRELILKGMEGASKVKQIELASNCGVSIGLVNKTIENLRRLGQLRQRKPS